MASDSDPRLDALANASLPEVGSLHAWMPLKAHVTTVVRVIGVSWDEGEFWIDASDLRNPHTARKSLRAWVSSTVALDDEAARDAMQTLNPAENRAW